MLLTQVYNCPNLSELRANCDPSWIPPIEYVSDKLLPYLRKEANRDPRVRKAIKTLPWVLGGIGFVAYFAIRFISATPTDNALETRLGIKERAAALEKVIRYDDWMDTHVRKGGWLKGILLWPIEPTEAEIKGASEFASLAFEAHQISVEQFACPEIPRGNGTTPSEEELKYLSEVAAYLRRSNVEWSDPPVVTAIEAAKAFGGC